MEPIQRLRYIVDQYLYYKEELSIASKSSLSELVNLHESGRLLKEILAEGFENNRQTELELTATNLQKVEIKIGEFENVHLENLFFFLFHLLEDNFDYLNWGSDIELLELKEDWRRRRHFHDDKTYRKAVWKGVKKNFDEESFIREYSGSHLIRRETPDHRKEYNNLTNGKTNIVINNSSIPENISQVLDKAKIADSHFDSYKENVNERQKLLYKREILNAMQSDQEFMAYFIKNIQEESRWIQVGEELSKISKKMFH